MNIIVLLIFGILFIISITTLCVSEYGVSIFTAFLSGIFLGIFLYELSISEKPTAIDVYKGKTTLEITYRDSVAIDSVVVFKKK